MKSEQVDDEDEEEDGTELPAVCWGIRITGVSEVLIKSVEGTFTEPHPARGHSTHAIITARAGAFRSA